MFSRNSIYIPRRELVISRCKSAAHSTKNLKKLLKINEAYVQNVGLPVTTIIELSLPWQLPVHLLSLLSTSLLRRLQRQVPL